jgi:SAM-dependent methyltransferase
MRTRLEPDNPYGCDRFGFAWHHVRGGAHLDYGCNDGGFLFALGLKRLQRRVGLDVSRDAVAEARRKFPDLDIRHIAAGAPLPLEDAAFDSVTLLDVLEHVDDQAGLLAELGRVLKPDGRLIISVPGRYLFSFTDLGNFKFRFPRLHRWLYTLTHSRRWYEERYGANPDGLVGDVSARKRWHEHFSMEGLESLLGRAGFRVTEADGAGYFARPLMPAVIVAGRVPGLRRLVRWFVDCDERRFTSMHRFCVAVKK